MRTRIWHSDWKPRWLIRCVSAALLSFMDKQVRVCQLEQTLGVVEGYSPALEPHHPDQLAPLGVTQRLDHLEDARVAQRPVGSVELTLGHDPFSELASCHLAIHPEMAHADVGDLALLEGAVADHVAGTLMLGLRE